MGFFSSAGDKYSNDEKSLSEIEIKQLVSRTKVKTLDANEEKAVESAISKRRKGDGKISLRQIYEALTLLKSAGRISQYDRTGLMTVFQEYFESK